MLDPVTLALTILFLPLAAAVMAAACNNNTCRHLAHWPLVICGGGAAVLALVLLSTVVNGTADRYISVPVTWFSAGKIAVNFVVTVDPLSCVMLAMITFIATLIAIFSSGYMEDHHHQPDRGYARFFGVMGLFVFSMCGLVLANDFLLLVGFWEGVGVCSYLLIGYYYDKPSAAEAARKAFLVTRLGDVGFILGIFLFWKIGGWNTELTALFDHIRDQPPDTPTLTLACLLIFCGAVGKSAQFPLYVWLPDAMEGPTPVSALIHAATMVTAGVYLLARTAPLFALAPDASLVVAVIGGFTALLAGFLALAQNDLKRILAYSTVSQLGYMFLALGTVGVISPVFAVTAAMFHLITHAFFKALLFLGSGSVMHSMGGVIDMRRFGGLRHLMPVTHLTFLCGAAALAGVPLLSGFWSKDMIVETLALAGESSNPRAGVYFVLLLVALLTAFLTAFYTSRAYFLTFWGPLRVPEEAGPHPHESPSVMTLPLILLAVGAVAIGITLEPITHWFSSFLARTPSLVEATTMAGQPAVALHLNWGLAGVSALLALGGVGLAYFVYGAGGPERIPMGLAGLYKLSRDKLYVDEIYSATIATPAAWLAVMARIFDLFLDSLTRLIAAVPRFVGAGFRPIQNGLVQFYALSMALGLAVFLSFVVFRITR